MFGKETRIIATCVILVLGLVGCAVPATTEPAAVPEVQTVVVTQVVTSTPEPTPVVTATPEPTPVVATVEVPATEAPVLPTETPEPPTETPRPRPQATPTSAGLLSFPEPTTLDNWELVADGEYECTIIVRITGGAPPYTIHHDLEVFTTSDPNPPVVFRAQGCSAMIHTITVESADGQTASHVYALPPPWCKE